ncbi:MAG: type II toxin-antitoxin system prevent-host-death family antitoxin [Chitinispirillia bacterium]|jgi:prevent-host-death family protein
MIATAKDLRFHAKEILETTMRGEEVIITYRGKPTAKIIPFSQQSGIPTKEKNNKLFGIWKNKDDIDDVNIYINKIRKGRSF